GPFRLGKSLGCCRRAGLSCGRQSVLQPAGPEVGRDARSDGGNATSGGFLRGSRRRGLAARLESESGRGYDEEMTSASAGLSESRFDSNCASATAVLVLAALISSSCASRAAPAPGSAPPAAPTRAASSANPPPAASVPEQPTPPPASQADRPYRKILDLKRSGATDEELLRQIRSDNVNYQLTTAEILELRDAGVSPAVLEGMLRSGRN